MRSWNVILAVEDRLSEAVATKVLTTLGFEIVRRPREQRSSDLRGKSHLTNNDLKTSLNGKGKELLS